MLKPFGALKETTYLRHAVANIIIRHFAFVTRRMREMAKDVFNQFGVLILLYFGHICFAILHLVVDFHLFLTSTVLPPPQIRLEMLLTWSNRLFFRCRKFSSDREPSGVDLPVSLKLSYIC